MATRLEVKAKIKRASRSARENADQLDAKSLDALQGIYERAVADVGGRIEQLAGSDSRVTLQALGSLKQSLEAVLSELDRVQRTALFERMAEVAAMGVEPVAEMLGAERVAQLTSAAVRSVRNFTADDGLQLSDRLWRINQHAKDVATSAIESAVIQGHSASQAAQDFLSRGVTVPDDVARKMGLADAAALRRAFGKDLMTGAGTPYDNARRLFRTEINRAHITAYQAGVQQLDDAVGTRFLLSPNHPEHDICDMHAKANLYGLGPGVYPHGKSPLPAHPNTLSYEEVVFADEVSSADRKAESRTDWIKAQPELVQTAVLGGVRKRQAFLGGHIGESAIATPWRVIKPRLEKRGIDIRVPKIQVTAPASSAANDDGKNPFTSRPLLPPFQKKADAERMLKDKYANVVDFEGATTAAMNSIVGAVDRVIGRYDTRINRMVWSGHKYPGAGGVYERYVNRPAFGNDTMYLNKSFMHGGAKKEVDNHLIYLESRKSALEDFDRRIAAAASPSMRERLQQLREFKEAAMRWSSVGVSRDPVYSTVAHESGHALFYQGQLVEKWTENLAKHAVGRVDWYRVSEYAGTNESELFAEVTAFFADGRENMVPKNVAEAYIETLREFRVVK